jgi:hypothetical protein
MSKHRLDQLEQTLERILSALEEHYQPDRGTGESFSSDR